MFAVEELLVFGRALERRRRGVALDRRQLELYYQPQIRLRDMAAAAGITERAAGSIVSDLEDAGYITGQVFTVDGGMVM